MKERIRALRSCGVRGLCSFGGAGGGGGGAAIVRLGLAAVMAMGLVLWTRPELMPESARRGSRAPLEMPVSSVLTAGEDGPGGTAGRTRLALGGASISALGTCNSEPQVLQRQTPPRKPSSSSRMAASSMAPCAVMGK